MIKIDEIRELTAGHALVREIDVVPKGHVRLETAFLYPDGSSIDVFVRNDAPLRLSDLGQTTTWLLDMQLRPWLSKKRQRFVAEALRLHGVEQAGGALELRLASPNSLVAGIVSLGQAAVRVADLTYTRRSALLTLVTEELEEFLSDENFEFEANATLPGRANTSVKVDFLVTGPGRKSAIQTLASGSGSQAHIAANEIFKRWYDLRDRPENRITVFDDRTDVYRDEDLDRLRDFSDVVAISDKQTLSDLLA